MRTQVRYSLVALTAVAVLAAPASSVAKKSKRSGSDTQFVACVKNKNGVMLLRPASTTGCKKGWKKIWWNTTGPQGPAGKNGADGSNGAQGPQGPAGTNGTDGTNGTNGTNGVSGLETLISDSVNVPNFPLNVTMTCPGTKQAISGGWFAFYGGLDRLYVSRSYPSGSQWRFEVSTQGSGGFLPANFYVLCANAS